jgi:hypothetical protein
MEASKGFSIEMGELIKVTVCPAPIEFFIIHIGVRMHPPCQSKKSHGSHRATKPWRRPHSQPVHRGIDRSFGEQTVHVRTLSGTCYVFYASCAVSSRELRTRVQVSDPVFGKFLKKVCATFSSPTSTKYAATKCPGLPRHIAGESATYTSAARCPVSASDCATCLAED